LIQKYKNKSKAKTMTSLFFTIKGKKYNYSGTPKTRFQDFFKLLAGRTELTATPEEVFACYVENFPDTMGFDEASIHLTFVKAVERRKEKEKSVDLSATVIVQPTPTTTTPPKQRRLSMGSNVPPPEDPTRLSTKPTSPEAPKSPGRSVRRPTITDTTSPCVVVVRTPPSSPPLIPALPQEVATPRKTEPAKPSATPKERSPPTRHIDPLPPSGSPATTKARVKDTSAQTDAQRDPKKGAEAQLILEDVHQYILAVLNVPATAATIAPTNTEKEKFICLSLDGSESNKLIKVCPDTIDYATFLDMVRKKLNMRSPMDSRLLLSFTDEQGELIDVDDDASLAILLDQDVKKIKLQCVIQDMMGGGSNLDRSQRDSWAGPPTLDFTLVTPRDRHVSVSSCAVPNRMHVAHTGAIYSCALSFDGQRLLTAGRDKKLRVWRTNDWHLLGELNHHKGFVLGCAFAPPKALRCISCSDDKTAIIWDNNNMFRPRQVLAGHTDKVYGCSWSEDANFVATGSCDRTVRVWDATTGSTARVLDRNHGSVFYVTFSKSHSALLYTAGDDTLVKMFDLRTPGLEVRAFRGHSSTVWSCQVSDSEKYLVSSSMDHSVRVWDLDSGQCISNFSHHCAPVHHAIFTPSERYVVSCARDKCINVTEIATGQPVNVLRGHTNIVYHVDMKDGVLASCSMDETARLWEMPPQL
jgi:WD40 repeat protein